jgi:PncC family amidohydrolase
MRLRGLCLIAAVLLLLCLETLLGNLSKLWQPWNWRGVLGVGAATIGTHGAVSEPVAVEMAHGAAARLGADVTVAVTGIAGPDGGTAEKPVGLVCFGFHVRGHEDSMQRMLFGDRDEIRARASQLALFEVYRRLRSLPD